MVFLRNRHSGVISVGRELLGNERSEALFVLLRQREEIACDGAGLNKTHAIFRRIRRPHGPVLEPDLGVLQARA